MATTIRAGSASRGEPSHRLPWMPTVRSAAFRSPKSGWKIQAQTTATATSEVMDGMKQMARNAPRPGMRRSSSSASAKPIAIAGGTVPSV
jgi:hypothetical protein